MKKRSSLLLILTLLCGLYTHAGVYAEEVNSNDYFKTLTPELVLAQANKDMKELYGLDNYYPMKTSKGPFNRNLVQKQINEAVQNPKKFTGFDIVYGSSHALHCL